MSFLSSDVTIQGQEQVRNQESPTYNQEGGLLVVNGMDLSFDILGGSVMVILILVALLIAYKARKERARDRKDRAEEIALKKLNKYAGKEERAARRVEELESSLGERLQLPFGQQIADWMWGPASTGERRSCSPPLTSSSGTQSASYARQLSDVHQRTMRDLERRLEQEREQEVQELSAQFRRGIEAMEARNLELRERLARLQASMSVQGTSLGAMRVPTVVQPAGEPSVLTESRLHGNRWAAVTTVQSLEDSVAGTGRLASTPRRQPLRVSYQLEGDDLGFEDDPASARLDSYS